MRHVGGAYTTYFNVKRKRVGHLFQGRYKAFLVDKDGYALELSRYIHLNPVRAGMVNSPEEYLWSSYRAFIGQSRLPVWLSTGFILGCVGGDESGYEQFVKGAFDGEDDNPFAGVVASTILGGPKFVATIVRDHLKHRKPDRNVPAVRQLNRPSLDRILCAVTDELGTNGALVRNVSIYFCHRYSGARLKEIGELFALSDAAVAQASRRMRVLAGRDESVNCLLKRIAMTLGLSEVET